MKKNIAIALLAGMLVVSIAANLFGFWMGVNRDRMDNFTLFYCGDTYNEMARLQSACAAEHLEEFKYMFPRFGDGD